MTTRARQTLDPDSVLRAYSDGFFPMADSGTGEISWYSPDPRAIIPLDTFCPSRSLRRFIRKRIMEVRIDTAFHDVISRCAQREETWISKQIVEAYCALHSLGYAHSVESWQGGKIVGGLYGVALGGAFFGESMFSVVANASKVALVYLVELLNSRHFIVLDAQYITDHLRGLGAVEIPRSAYLKILSEALGVESTFPSSLLLGRQLESKGLRTTKNAELKSTHE